MTLQEGLDVDIEGGAGHGEVEGVNDVGVKDTKAPDGFPAKKDFGAAAREECGI